MCNAIIGLRYLTLHGWRWAHCVPFSSTVLGGVGTGDGFEYEPSDGDPQEMDTVPPPPPALQGAYTLSGRLVST